MKQTIEIKIPADLSLSSTVRNMAVTVFTSAGFSKEWCNRLKLVVDELFMNAVQYGSTYGVSVVQISFAFDAKTFECCVEDDGTGTIKVSPKALKEMLLDEKITPNPTQTSGRGLSVIAHLWTDHIDIKKSALGGIMITFVKTIESQDPPTPVPHTPLNALVNLERKKEPTTPPLASPSKPSLSPPVTTVKLNGEIDAETMDATIHTMEDHIHQLSSGSTLVLDFKNVDYINSTFIGYLAAWHNEIISKSVHLQIKNVNVAVRDVLDLVGLSNVLDVQ
ncbi:hypothetical protein COY07_00885 [Candidatus Peregrinibacteria bacterium CG_4_10_14_0_2_um_filter_43_11]|nr:MAG: hypothetical protein COY07_00885 [Candidatus Peregrinibacteria bacterium CG_4_10_14_0_2_um_filter_43_11]